MKLKPCVLVCLAIVNLLSSGVLRADQEEFQIARSGVTNIGAVSGNMAVKILIHTVRIDKSNIAFPSLEETPEIKNITIINSLEIFVNERKISVPHSVYADLLDPGKAFVRSDNGTFILTINGGDASLSYVLRLYFDIKQIHRRILYSAIIPDDPIQETLYWVRELKDVE
jgi:hypothetical protein